MRITTKSLAVTVLAASLSACANSSSTSKKQTAEYYAQLGAGYLQKNRLELAQENLDKALKVNRNSKDALHYSALLQERLGNMQKADSLFKRAMQLDSKNPELLNNYGSHLCKQGQYKAAVTAFNAALQDPLYETPEFAYTNAGVCLQSAKVSDQAEGYYRKALERNPNFPLALYQMAELEYARGENAKAQAFLYRYNERAQSTAETLFLCYKINRALNDSTATEECVTKLIAQFPNSVEAKQIN
ncbi:type IV pilus biogenesis/stability protein PilW [uncultured Thiothrix sp.]|uniref:type IV pilus biogenesis/stability protein PilW n=1 Tax=uncultured Thiothrix sp. TaxID=223185 RepID=UPI00260B95BC|nr:type IV pilus biogenesis/stability protein PilW [uncultured Thiothrix sp.]HMT92953.1 type IV pilus biogenesis/stability protein PilW [Thiolinea sp.]